jgi:hypothetical protein
MIDCYITPLEKLNASELKCDESIALNQIVREQQRETLLKLNRVHRYALTLLKEMLKCAIKSTNSTVSDIERSRLNRNFQNHKNAIRAHSEHEKVYGQMAHFKSSVAAYVTSPTSSKIKWDQEELTSAGRRTLDISQCDGNRQRRVTGNLAQGMVGINGIPYCFETVDGQCGEFLLHNRGKELIYVAQENAPEHQIYKGLTLMRLDLSSNLVSHCSVPSALEWKEETSSLQISLTRDEKGQVWALYPSAKCIGLNLVRVNLERSMGFDLGNSVCSQWAGQEKTDGVGYISAESSCPRFAVYKDRITYIEEDRSGYLNCISQNLNSPSDRQVLLHDLKSALGFSKGTPCAFSLDGSLLAWIDSELQSNGYGILKTCFISNGRFYSKLLPASAKDLIPIGFDRNGRFYCRYDLDSSSREIWRFEITPDFAAERLEISEPGLVRTILVTPNPWPLHEARMRGIGISVLGDCPISAGGGMDQEVADLAMDLSAINLGINESDISSQSASQRAIGAVDAAYQRVESAYRAVETQLQLLVLSEGCN